MAEFATIARPYAKAIFSLGLETNTLVKWQQALESLAQMASDKQLKQLFNNPKITKKEWLGIFTATPTLSLSDEGKNFLEMLIDRKRIVILPAIYEQFLKLLNDYQKRIEVKVVSAYPEIEAKQNELTQKLRHFLQRDIVIDFSVDRSILGGAVIYAGDLMIDGSLRGRLNRLAETLSS